MKFDFGVKLIIYSIKKVLDVEFEQTYKPPKSYQIVDKASNRTLLNLKSVDFKKQRISSV